MTLLLILSLTMTLLTYPTIRTFLAIFHLCGREKDTVTVKFLGVYNVGFPILGPLVNSTSWFMVMAVFPSPEVNNMRIRNLWKLGG